MSLHRVALRCTREGHPVKILEVVILTGRLILIMVVVIVVAGTFSGVVAAGGRTLPGELGLFGASRRAAAHPPQLVGEGPPPAAVLANRAQEPDELGGLLPVRSSLALAAPGALLVHGGEHLTDVGGQQVVHLVALQV